MVDLMGEGRRVVDALLAAAVAWQSPVELAWATGLDVESTVDLLADLDVGGWLSAWDRESGAVVTLSVGAAARLGVRLVEPRPGADPRWARAGDPEPRPARAEGVFRGDGAAILALVVDDAAASADRVAEAREEALIALNARPDARRDLDPVDRLPKPTLLIGTGLTPWPGPGDGRKASCPSCRSRALKAHDYCLRCDRWGLDHFLRDASPTARRAAPIRRDDPDRRDLERQARKRKRQARRLAQADGTGRARPFRAGAATP